MAKRGRKPDLEKKREAIKKLEAEIKALERAEKIAQANLQKQRDAVTGAALAEEMASNPDLAKQFAAIIDRRVKKAADRKLLGLPSLRKKPKEGEQDAS